MPLDDVNDTFATLAKFIAEPEDDAGPEALLNFAMATAGLALARIVVTDLRRIANAQEAMANIYCHPVATSVHGALK